MTTDTDSAPDDREYLRAMLAGQALQGLLASGRVAVGQGQIEVVNAAVWLADALLTQLEATKPAQGLG